MTTLLPPPGGLFEADEDEQKLVFRYALDTINEERTILPRTNLRGLVEHVDRDDSFNVDKKGENSIIYSN